MVKKSGTNPRRNGVIISWNADKDEGTVLRRTVKGDVQFKITRANLPAGLELSQVLGARINFHSQRARGLTRQHECIDVELGFVAKEE